MRHPFNITFLGQNVTVNVTITNQLTQIKDTHIPLNGGEGGIRTPGTLSGTTDFESVTFGHSATSPKNWARKSCLRALASLDYRSVSDNSPKS